MQIIDTHQHFWHYTPEEYDWIDDKMEVLKEDYLPNHLKSIYEANQIEGCVSVQASSTETETRRLLSFADHHSFIKGVVGWIDLCAENIDELLEHYSQYPKLKGFRHVLQSEPNEFMEGEDFLRGLSKLSKRNLTYDVLIYPKHLFSAYHLAKKFPDQQFVIDHCAKPPIRQKDLDTWKDMMSNFQPLPNVFCKVSGMVTEADWHEWRYKDFIPVMDTVTEVFGPDRIMYGSDWPVCLLAGSYKNVLDILLTYTSDWSEDEKHKVLYKNAITFYHLD